MLWEWPEEMLRETRRITEQKLALLRRAVERRRTKSTEAKRPDGGVE